MAELEEPLKFNFEQIIFNLSLYKMKIHQDLQIQ